MIFETVAGFWNGLPLAWLLKVKSAYTGFFRSELSQGREYSWSTGLYYFRLRHYDPTVGRFLSNDPIGISGGLDQYAFCGNNPVNFRDPYGTCKGSASTTWNFLGEVNPFNMNGSLNNQVAAGFSMMLGDTAGGEQLSGMNQLYTGGASEGTRYAYGGSLAISAAASATAAWMIGAEAAAANGFYNIANSVANRAVSPFLKNQSARWFSQTQMQTLMNGERLANTGQGLKNLLTTFRYASKGNGEVVFNWITRTVVHSNPFF